MAAAADWEDVVRALLGSEFPPVLACSPVNADSIRQWCQAMGTFADAGDSAPATMLQCWLAPAPGETRPPGSANEDATSVLALLAEAGYGGVITVGTEMEFLRPLRAGDVLHYTSALESISEEKVTSLGSGRFLGFRFTVRDASSDAVGIIRFNNLAYRLEA